MQVNKGSKSLEIVHDNRWHEMLKEGLI